MEAKNIEPVRVVARCRPLLSREIQEQREPIVKVNQEQGEISIANPTVSSNEDPKNLSFDHVFGPDTSQSIIYNEIAFPLVDSVLQGYNGTIFAYGQTGAGKTYTMQGNINSGSEETKGIIPRAIKQIFSFIESTPEKQFVVRVSFLEIYNEQVQDLLNKDQKSPLQIREKRDFGIYVEGLLSLPVESVAEGYQKLVIGNQNRTIQQTRMSAMSSRSHAIFSVVVESSEAGPDRKAHVKVGKLNLVDLAGSERLSKTGATGLILREAACINKSLTVLRNIICALTDPRARHVPYRDSKLTRLLQDSLGGNTKTVMIANIGPADWNYEETLSTLRLAYRAKSIMNKPTINEDLKDNQEEVEKSKGQLNGFQGEKLGAEIAKEGDGDKRQSFDEERKMIEIPADPVDAERQRLEETQKVDDEKKILKEEASQQQEGMEKLKEKLEEKIVVEQILPQKPHEQGKDLFPPGNEKFEK